MAASIRMFTAVLALASFALAAPVAAAEITVTKAKIAEGKLLVTGHAGAGRVTLDGKFTERSHAYRGFSFAVVYLPTDCIVELAVVGSSHAPTKVVVADCVIGGGLNPRGAWKPSVEYFADDFVTSLGSAWFAKRDNLGKAPSTHPQDWEKFVSQGDAGPKGDTGPKGERGAKGPEGDAGPKGDKGAKGPEGDAGPKGDKGAKGDTGQTGPQGATGAQGPQGATGAPGPQGVMGLQGLQGIPGPTGPAGPGGALAFADFFALMPPDNAATVAPGTDVSFPRDGPNSAGSVTRTGPSSFNLAAIGTYQVTFQVSVTEAGQLILTLNGADLAYTVVGRATGTSQIMGTALVQTTVINSILTLRNPAGNSTALTITPLAGGTRPVSAHLTVLQIQ